MASKKKLYFFPGIEYGNSIDVLATSSNTVLMSEKALLLHSRQARGEPEERGHVGSKGEFGGGFLSPGEKFGSPLPIPVGPHFRALCFPGEPPKAAPKWKKPQNSGRSNVTR